MSYIIRTRCPNGCKYKSGYTCVASECPYQTGDVRYDIRLNAEYKPTKINAKAQEQAVIEFAEKLKRKAFDKDMFNDWAGSTYVVLVREIDKLLKDYEKCDK